MTEKLTLEQVLNAFADALMQGRASHVRSLCDRMGPIGDVLYESAVELYRVRAGLIRQG